MSKIAKGAKKIGSKIKGFVKDYWKEILIAAAIVFTAGIATVGLGAYTAAVGSSASGFWAATGSTMWAGATSIAGTFGIGSGAQGSVAAGAGMEGATLMTGAGAQSLGVASAGTGSGASGAVGQYTGPGSSFMGGDGSVFGGRAQPTTTVQPTVTGETAAQSMPHGSEASQQAGQQQASTGLMGDMARAASPALVMGASGYFQGKAAEEAYKPKAMWGVDLKTGEAHQPRPAASPGQSGMKPGQRFIGQDGKQYEVGPDGQPHEIGEDQGLMFGQPGHMAYGGYT